MAKRLSLIVEVTAPDDMSDERIRNLLDTILDVGYDAGIATYDMEDKDANDLEAMSFELV